MDGSEKWGAGTGAEGYPKQLTKPRSMVVENIPIEESVMESNAAVKGDNNLS